MSRGPSQGEVLQASEAPSRLDDPILAKVKAFYESHHDSLERSRRRHRYFYDRLLRELEVAGPATLARQIHLLIEGAIVSAHTFGDPVAATQAREAALALVAAATRT